MCMRHTITSAFFFYLCVLDTSCGKPTEVGHERDSDTNPVSGTDDGSGNPQADSDTGTKVRQDKILFHVTNRTNQIWYVDGRMPVLLTSSEVSVYGSIYPPNGCYRTCSPLGCCDDDKSDDCDLMYEENYHWTIAILPGDTMEVFRWIGRLFYRDVCPDGCGCTELGNPYVGEYAVEIDAWESVDCLGECDPLNRSGTIDAAKVAGRSRTVTQLFTIPYEDIPLYIEIPPETDTESVPDASLDAGEEGESSDASI
jgi:hypothetical protein